VGFDDNQQLGVTGAEAALPAWIEFMKDALAIRPSLGGSSFAKPGGIVTVKIDPETGELAGPNCPTSQTVRVAAQFAPMVECSKHLPAMESQDDATDAETEPAIADSGSVELEPSEESSDQPPSISNRRQSAPDDEVQPAAQPKMNRRETRTDVSPGGRQVLINKAVVPDAAPTPGLIRNRRP
jgi:hypothetical protein